MKQLLKRTLLAAAPEWTICLLSARARAHSHRMVAEWGLTTLTEKLLVSLGPAVQSGPFAGMTLTPMTHREHLGPFLLGTYEFELHPWIVAIAARQFNQILDIGAKFGYYAIGLARLFPETPVLAFDTDWWARAACRQMASVNRTPNVKVHRFCSPHWLQRNLQPGSLIVSDCEGFERELLTPSSSPALRLSTLIVETHDEISPGTTEAIRARFTGSHDLAIIETSQTTRPDPPVDLSFLTESEVRSAKHEVRGRQRWLRLTPKDRGH
jgi:hypothetical protein